MQEIYVEYHDLPTTIRGFSRETSEGYVIVINSRMSSDMQLRAYKHELEHIKNDDFNSHKSVDVIEALRHERSK